MNSKNILIAFGVLGIGLVLYKVLLGFVLPIALFVSLGYVLKFLLKGADSEGGQEVSQVFSNSSTSTSTDNVVEIQPIIEDKIVNAEPNVDQEKSVKEDSTIEKEKPVVGKALVQEEKTVNEDKVVDEKENIDEDISIN